MLLQWSGPDGPVTATWIHGRSPYLLSAKWDLTRTVVSARRTDVVTRSDILHGEFKYPSWHGVKARRQQLASQWPGEPAVMTKKNPTKSYRVVRGSLFPANEGTCIPLLGVLLLNCSKQSIPNPAHKTICQNKTSNALPMANRMCCENEAAADSLSRFRNSDNYQ